MRRGDIILYTGISVKLLGIVLRPKPSGLDGNVHTVTWLWCTDPEATMRRIETIGDGMIQQIGNVQDADIDLGNWLEKEVQEYYAT